MSTRPSVVGLLAALVVALACSGSADYVSPGAPSSGFGPGISIEEALKSNLDGPLLVNGWLFVSASKEVRLCSSLSESRPPQCGGPSLLVKGLDLTEVANLRQAGGRAWSESAVQLLGAVKAGELVIAAGTRG